MDKHEVLGGEPFKARSELKKWTQNEGYFALFYSKGLIPFWGQTSKFVIVLYLVFFFLLFFKSPVKHIIPNSA